MELLTLEIKWNEIYYIIMMIIYVFQYLEIKFPFKNIAKGIQVK